MDEPETVPWIGLISNHYLILSPFINTHWVNRRRHIYSLLLSIGSFTSEEAEFMNHNLWRMLNPKAICSSHLVEICFEHETVERHDKFFSNVIKSFASLMEPSQVLSIGVLYHRLFQDVVNSLWRAMYARMLRGTTPD